MLYSETLLTKQGPLAPVWLAANLERKVSRTQFLNVDIKEAVAALLHQPLGLRLYGQLLLGIMRIYHRKAKYLVQDTAEALQKLKRAFSSVSVDLPASVDNASRAKNLILSNTITELDLMAPELPPELGGEILLTTVFSDSMVDSQRSSSSFHSRLQQITLPSYDNSIEIARDSSGGIEDDQELENLQGGELDLNFNFNDVYDQSGDSLLGNITAAADDIEVARDANFSTPVRQRNEHFDDFSMDLDLVDDHEKAFSSPSIAQPVTPRIEDLGDIEFEDHLTISSSGAVARTRQDTRKQPRKVRKTMKPDEETELSYSTLKALQDDRSAILRNHPSLPRNAMQEALARFTNPFTSYETYLFDEPVIERALNIKITPENIRNFIRDNSRVNPDNTDFRGEEVFSPPSQDIDVSADLELELRNSQPPSEQENFNFSVNDFGMASSPPVVDDDYAESDPLGPTERVAPGISESTLQVAERLRTALSENPTINLTDLQPQSKHEAVQNFFEILVLATKGSVTVKQETSFGEIKIAERNSLSALFV